MMLPTVLAAMFVWVVFYEISMHYLSKSKCRYSGELKTIIFFSNWGILSLCSILILYEIVKGLISEP
jgi:hypothetical protein